MSHQAPQGTRRPSFLKKVAATCGSLIEWLANRIPSLRDSVVSRTRSTWYRVRAWRLPPIVALPLWLVCLLALLIVPFSPSVQKHLSVVETPRARNQCCAASYLRFFSVRDASKAVYVPNSKLPPSDFARWLLVNEVQLDEQMAESLMPDLGRTPVYVLGFDVRDLMARHLTLIRRKRERRIEVILLAFYRSYLTEAGVNQPDFLVRHEQYLGSSISRPDGGDPALATDRDVPRLTPYVLRFEYCPTRLVSADPARPNPNVHSVARIIGMDIYPSGDLPAFGAAGSTFSALLAGFALTVAALLLERRGSNTTKASRADRHLHRTAVSLLLLSCGLLAFATASGLIVSGLPAYSMQALLLLQVFALGLIMGISVMFYGLFLAMLQNSNSEEYRAAQYVLLLAVTGTVVLGAFQSATVPAVLVTEEGRAAAFLPGLSYLAGGFLLAVNAMYRAWWRPRRQRKSRKDSQHDWGSKVQNLVGREVFEEADPERVVAKCHGRTGEIVYNELTDIVKWWSQGRRQGFSDRLVLVSWYLIFCILFSLALPYVMKQVAPSAKSEELTAMTQIVWWGSCLWCLAINAILRKISHWSLDWRFGVISPQGVRRGAGSGSEKLDLSTFTTRYRSLRERFVPFSETYLLRVEVFIGIAAGLALIATLAGIAVLLRSGGDYSLRIWVIGLHVSSTMVVLFGLLNGVSIATDDEEEKGVAFSEVVQVRDVWNRPFVALLWDSSIADRADTFFVLGRNRASGTHGGAQDSDLLGKVGDYTLPLSIQDLQGDTEQAPAKVASKGRGVYELNEDEFIREIHDLASTPEEWQVAAILPVGSDTRGLYSAIDVKVSMSPKMAVLAHARYLNLQAVLLLDRPEGDTEWRIVYYDEDTELNQSSRILVHG